MLKKLILACAVLVTGLGLLRAPDALAAAATEQKATESVEIAAPPDKVWAIIGNFSDLTWHPAIKSSNATTATRSARCARSISAARS